MDVNEAMVDTLNTTRFYPSDLNEQRNTSLMMQRQGK